MGAFEEIRLLQAQDGLNQRKDGFLLVVEVLVQARDQTVGELPQEVRPDMDVGQSVVDRCDKEDESGVFGLDRLQARQIEAPPCQGLPQRRPQRLSSAAW
ncbi:hypothetical protein DWB77_00190 [Streptomyces hundungensis]|uniref:Uncharacterized protein n=1 Tax=Streptomyces hundungensis TaxID=1077946 RepID=A0A387H7E7_9ACTN|nr:hypothetical protein [Streptomyces hundungensis]AYG78083.1 hypothetical protein DWB77_00190 [Streptomyces hundungensis]